MNRDKIGTQTCYIHQCTKRYVDVHSMSVSQSCPCSFLCNPYIHFKFPKFFYLLVHIVYLREFCSICMHTKYIGTVFVQDVCLNVVV